MKRILYIAPVLLLAASAVFGQDALVTVFNDTVAANPGIGVNISPGVSGSWQGATFLSQMCRDGSFEGPEIAAGDDTGVITGWKKTGEGAVYSAERANPYAGAQAQKIVLSGATAGIQNWRLKWQLNRANRYTISMALRAENFSSYVDIRLRYWNNGLNQFSPRFTPDEEWRVFTWEFTPDESDELGELYIRAHGTGTLYIDEFKMYISANYRDDGFDQKFIDYLIAFRPAALRWGGIGANFDGGFNRNTLPRDFRDDMSYGDFFHLCELVSARANLVIAVADTQDFYRDPQTARRLVEYIGGSVSTEGGAIREREGYEAFHGKGKGFLIEFGNEVWGSDAHGAPWSQDTRKEYIAWCRERMNIMRATPAYDPEKFTLIYCGRRANYQWWDRWDMINGENGEGDWWAITGYLGSQGGTSGDAAQRQYLMSGFAYTQWYAGQVGEHYAYMQQTIGKRLPLFIYEGNFDRGNYFHRLGQSIVYLDFLAQMIRVDVALPMLFHFAAGGQWGMVNNVFGNYKRQPLYYAGLLFNNYCRGPMLRTEINNAPLYTHPAWDEVPEQTFAVIGHYAFREHDRTAVLLINRDLERDHDVRVTLDTEAPADAAILYRLAGESWNDFNAYADFNNEPETVRIEEETIHNFQSGASIALPKHSAAVLVLQSEATTNVTAGTPTFRDWSYRTIGSSRLVMKMPSAARERLQVRLFTLAGTLAYSKELRGGLNKKSSVVIDIPSLSSGLYFLNISDNIHRYAVKKVLIMK